MRSNVKTLSERRRTRKAKSSIVKQQKSCPFRRNDHEETSAESLEAGYMEQQHVPDVERVKIELEQVASGSWRGGSADGWRWRWWMWSPSR